MKTLQTKKQAQQIVRPKFETKDLIKAMNNGAIYPTSYYSFRIKKKLRAVDKARIIIAAILLRDDSDNFNKELMSEIHKFQKLSK